jgi:hypothetical protein
LRELQAGLWHWQAQHPDWTPDEHERDTETLVERFGMSVYTPLPDTAQDLMHKYGITDEQAGEGRARGSLAVTGADKPPGLDLALALHVDDP